MLIATMHDAWVYIDALSLLVIAIVVVLMVKR